MPQLRLAVAVSGGRDSTALLHCTLRQAKALSVQVVALHVHHGLMLEADAWAAQVRQQSRRWGATFDCRRLAGGPGQGESVEAWARAGRYQALAELAQAHGCQHVLLAHHRRDQAETWLLQALRGAGAAGLAAMPEQAMRGGIHWLRPWLATEPEVIEAYVRRHRLKYVVDPSNADARFARSRLRHQVWPSLLAAFPDAEVSLAAAAQRAQEALALAIEAAQADLSVLVQDAALRCTPWLQLPPARRLNALRAWLGSQGAAPPQTLLDRLLRELPNAEQGKWPAPGAVLRLHRGLLRLADVESPTAWDGVAALPLDLNQAGRFLLPAWGGHFQVDEALHGGVHAQQLRGVLPTTRQGGERFRLRPGAPSRSLKKQFQTCAIPAWQRQGPLLMAPSGALMYVPGLGLDAAFQAPAGVPQLQVNWVPAVDP